MSTINRSAEYHPENNLEFNNNVKQEITNYTIVIYF